MSKLFKTLLIVIIILLIIFFTYVGSYDFTCFEQYPVVQKKEEGRIYFECQKKRPSYWVNFGKISPIAIGAIVVSEDWAFYEHKGVDFNQLKVILRDFLKTHEFSRGGSTITQQVIKNIFFSHERSYLRKLLEMYLAYRLEQKYSKEKILEFYLNIIEFGEDLYGIESASLFYFNKTASSLTLKEGAFLAMLLPNPIRYSESYRDRKLTDFAKDSIQEISIKLRQARFIDEEERIESLKQKFSWEEEEVSASDLWEQ